MTAKNALGLALAAGLATTAIAETPNKTVYTDGTQQPAVIAGHMYVNLATGERTLTRFNQQDLDAGFGSRSPDDSGNDTIDDNLIWAAANVNVCGGGSFVAIIDDPDNDGDFLGDVTARPSPDVGGTRPLTGNWHNFPADIGANTVVDCFTTAFSTNSVDAAGTGIVGQDLRVTFADGDSGFGADDPVSGRTVIFDLTLTTLPGPSTDPSPSFSVFFITIDSSDRNGNTPNPSFVFELGDDDGSDGTGGAGGFNPMGFNDIDGDGNHDFSWGFQYIQAQGAPLGAMGNFIASTTTDINGVFDAIGSPNSTTPSLASELANPDTTAAFPYIPDAGDLTFNAAALAVSVGDASLQTGILDGTDIYADVSDPGGTGVISTYFGTFFFGGHDCSAPTTPPGASGLMELHGPGGGGPVLCVPDFNPNPPGVLDFNDVVAFLTAFAAGDPSADLIPGGLDFNDVVAFLTAFAAGCP